jgi:hypothetical protein
LRDRPPPRSGVSPQARARLQVELGASLADTRTAWEAATLRGDAALQAGDREAAVRALDEQRALLRDLHARVDSVVGRAAVEREAESIVAGVGARAERRPGGARQRRQAAVALAGTIGVALVALLSVSPHGDPTVPDVAPVAAGDDDVTVSSTVDARPPVVTFEPVTDVLLELSPAVVHGGAAPGTDGQTRKEPGADAHPAGPPAGAGSSSRATGDGGAGRTTPDGGEAGPTGDPVDDRGQARGTERDDHARPGSAPPDGPDAGHMVPDHVEVEGRPEPEGSPGAHDGRATPRLDAPLVETDAEGVVARSLGGR